jgi:peptidoglycan-N-acetylglucosamine deacetylase
MYLRILILLILFYVCNNNSFAMEIAITVDDLPHNGQRPLNQSRYDIANHMLKTFSKHHSTAIHGFINGNKVATEPENVNILKLWLASGNYLGNHTYHHLDLAKVNTVDFLRDIKDNDQLLRQLQGNQTITYFRYPYLAEGNTQEKRDNVRNYLLQQDYQVAPVTVDFFEYEWNDPYVRCLKKHDTQAIGWLKKTYIEQSLNALIIANTLSQLLFNRDIKNILLIHINAFTSLMLDELLKAYEANGVRFITLPDALTDKAYTINPNIVRDRNYTFLNQVRLARGLANPEIVKQLYASLPEEKLQRLCT